MSYGLRTENSSGHVQIDSEYRSYELVAEGLQQTGKMLLNDVALQPPSGYDFDNCLVFVRPVNNNQVIGISSTTKTVMYLGGSVNGVSSNIPYEYRMYGEIYSDRVSDDLYGLEVFDASSKLVFDNRVGILRLSSYITTPHTHASPPMVLEGPGENGWVCINGTGNVTGYTYVSSYNYRMQVAGFVRINGVMHLSNITKVITGTGPSREPLIVVLIARD